MDVKGPYQNNSSANGSLKVAVTGGAASGKTSVCNRFEELGVKVISSDTLSREAVAPGSPAYEKIVNYFGKKVLTKKGHLNRQALRRIIVRNDSARKALEQIIHPEIIRQMHEKMAEAEKEGEPVILVEVPLLFELHLEDNFDVVVVVSTDYQSQVERLMERDKVSRPDAEALLRTQLPDAEKIERANYVIRNMGSREKMLESVDRLCRKFHQKMRKKD
jgi:dephospho-CoA kinase